MGGDPVKEDIKSIRLNSPASSSSIPLGDNVFSIFGGFKIQSIPKYRDNNRGKPKVTFMGYMRDCVVGSTGGAQTLLVQGNRTVFGLVLHRSIVLAGEPNRPWFNWTISEPMTGRFIVRGRTRQHTLDELALRVALSGGESVFRASLEEEAVRLTRRSMDGSAAAPKNRIG